MVACVWFLCCGLTNEYFVWWGVWWGLYSPKSVHIDLLRTQHQYEHMCVATMPLNPIRMSPIQFCRQ